MTGFTEPDSAVSDASSALHDPDHEYKQYVADTLSVHNIGDPVRREVRGLTRALPFFCNGRSPAPIPLAKCHANFEPPIIATPRPTRLTCPS